MDACSILDHYSHVLVIPETHHFLIDMMDMFKLNWAIPCTSFSFNVTVNMEIVCNVRHRKDKLTSLNTVIQSKNKNKKQKYTNTSTTAIQTLWYCLKSQTKDDLRTSLIHTNRQQYSYLHCAYSKGKTFQYTVRPTRTHISYTGNISFVHFDCLDNSILGTI